MVSAEQLVDVVMLRDDELDDDERERLQEPRPPTQFSPRGSAPRGRCSKEGPSTQSMRTSTAIPWATITFARPDVLNARAGC